MAAPVVDFGKTEVCKRRGADSNNHEDNSIYSMTRKYRDPPIGELGIGHKAELMELSSSSLGLGLDGSEKGDR